MGIAKTLLVLITAQAMAFSQGPPKESDWFLISSVRFRSLNGASVGLGGYKFNDSNFAVGPFVMGNVGVSGCKLDLGLVGWSTPEGPHRKVISPIAFPFGGLSAKFSVIYKWDDPSGKREWLYGVGRERIYFGAAATANLFLAGLELGYYRSDNGRERKVLISYGLGL
jgi:hypothetical protein